MRNWADTYYRHFKKKFFYSLQFSFAKNLYTQVLESEAENQEPGVLQQIEMLLEKACEKYAQTLQLNNVFANVYNSWALALRYFKLSCRILQSSTHAKITDCPEHSEKLFRDAFQKLEYQIQSRVDNEIEICNWCMVQVSQAIKWKKLKAKLPFSFRSLEEEDEEADVCV